MSDKKGLGTFLGVFTPTILTILGVIMYLRIGWVLGHMGLAKTLMIVVLANSITLITTLSFSSIATNIRVGVGGAYYIVSRSLGLEIGGAIGLPLFLSQAFSVTLYAFGLAESLAIVWPDVPVQAAAFVIVIAVALLSFKGAELALKTQIPIMFVVGISILMLATGAIVNADRGIPLHSPSGEVYFWVAFAVFFPAVTGIMAGLGLSGDLKDPMRSIPRGAIIATVVGFIIYISIPILLAMGADTESLKENPNIWSQIAPLGALLILPGLWGAIFSSAVGSMLGAPRTLQALAKDQLLSQPVARLAASETKGLRAGLIVTTIIALGGVMLGDLNAVAPVVTMFFLTVYGMVNIVAALEKISGNPSWRPRFQVPWQLSIAGGLACTGVMFLINPLAAAFAVFIEIIIFMFLLRKETQASWGDARRGIYEAMIRWALVQLRKHPVSARNWRPHMLTFVEDPIKHLDLMRFANWFSQERGVVTVCHLIVGDIMQEEYEVSAKKSQLNQILTQEGIVAFPEVDVTRNLVDGIIDVSQANGMAGMESNTVMLGWPGNVERLAEFLKIQQRLEKLNKSFIIARLRPKLLYPREGSKRIIHVWWRGLQHNGDIMLLLAHLLSRNPAWRGAKIKLMSIAENESARQNTLEYMRSFIPEVRIEAEISVILKPSDKSIKEIIQSSSAEAEAVFMGLATPAQGEELEYAKRLDDLAGDLSTVFFVKNSCMFVGKLLEVVNENVSIGSEKQ